MKFFRMRVLLALLIALFAVSGAAAQTATPQGDEDLELSGSSWLLTATSGQDHQTLVLPDSGITLSFDDESRISGNGGCNGYGGVYALEGDDEIALTEIISTLRACADNQLTTQESIYLSALSGVTHYELSENQLTLRIEDVESLHFVRADQDPLAGTSWRLINEVPAPVEVTPEVDEAEAPITLTFESEGHAAGHSGCNSFSATYTLDGTSIAFSDAISTMMACLESDIMEREREFLTALTDATQYGLTDERLYIRHGDGRLAFERVDDEMR